MADLGGSHAGAYFKVKWTAHFHFLHFTFSVERNKRDCNRAAIHIKGTDKGYVTKARLSLFPGFPQLFAAYYTKQQGESLDNFITCARRTMHGLLHGFG